MCLLGHKFAINADAISESKLKILDCDWEEEKNRTWNPVYNVQRKFVLNYRKVT